MQTKKLKAMLAQVPVDDWRELKVYAAAHDLTLQQLMLQGLSTILSRARRRAESQAAE